jgi:hypothetical protein
LRNIQARAAAYVSLILFANTPTFICGLTICSRSFLVWN